MKYEDLKCEFCDGQGEREVNIDGADCMCICTFCNETGVDLYQLEKFKVSIHKAVQQRENSGQLQQHVVMQALPDETITKEAIKYDALFGLTRLSTRELQIKAFQDGASFARETVRKASVASHVKAENE
jgi:hypothetical protein